MRWRSDRSLAILVACLAAVALLGATLVAADPPPKKGEDRPELPPPSEPPQVKPGFLLAGACSSPNQPIPDNDPGGITDILVITDDLTIPDLNVAIMADHTWVGDLIFTVTHVNTGVSVTLIHRPGYPTLPNGCWQQDVSVTLDDEGPDGPVENQCSATPPALFGSPTPNEPLSVFDGHNLSGTWKLTASDNSQYDEGTLVSWCLIPELRTYVSLVANDYCSGFNGPFEAEPNGTPATANGPLCANSSYLGTPAPAGLADDDFFFFDLPFSGTVQVDVTGYFTDAQAFLYVGDVSLANQVDWDTPDGDADYQVTHSGPADRYYVRLFAPDTHPSGGEYKLRVTFS